ncbi:MAG TPA: C40 family peptidase [Vicinamibacterales bacterium]|jgi:cell wall-associated NlpC family hydrolase|nr:C40 family peptidase [Vicinamibacterales bacterium]
MGSLASRVLLLIAAVGVAGACASTGAVPRPFPTPSSQPSTPNAQRPTPNAAIAYSVAGTALSLRGAPYRNGGSDPTGFDCSGFVRYVFSQHGVNVPRTVPELFRAGRQVTANQIEPGDLVFFTTVAPGASHVGIAIGGDEFVHAPSRTGEVRVEHMSGSYWSPRFVGARRVL